MLLVMPVSAKEMPSNIVTVPIDSRPISLEYLGNLVNLGGDNFISVDKSNLDKNTIKENYISGNSQKVRADLENIVSQNNTVNSSVIINTSSYLYDGLIDTRTTKDEKQMEQAIADLENLLTKYKNPTYYVHINFPRVLPDSRGSKIWVDNELIEGLGYYFVQTTSDITIDISSVTQYVTPEQFLLEWAYVINKKYELGDENLDAWEILFLENFEEQYLNNDYYKIYIENYQNTFKQTAEVIKTLINFTNDEKIDELIISIDDFQLPDFIQMLAHHTDVEVERNEDGNPTKFNWARYYLEVAPDSVYNYQQNSPDNVEDSILGRGKFINYIYGTDEIPQLIYARDLAKRTQITTEFLPINTLYTINDEEAYNEMGMFDLASTKELYNQRINYVTCAAPNNKNFFGVTKTDTGKPFQFYLNKYEHHQKAEDKKLLEFLVHDIYTNYNEGTHVGVIELYNQNLGLRQKRTLVKMLQDKNLLESLELDNNINQLAVYSSWNTEGNAIGLGVAHAQVFGIINELPLSNLEAWEQGKWHYKILLQHIIEDNHYTAGIKVNPHIKHYIGEEVDNINFMLAQELEIAPLFNSFANSSLLIGEEQVSYSNYEISQLYFPWERTYDLFVDIKVE